MGDDPPSFVSAWLPFGTLESVVFYIQQLQEWTMLETAKVVILFILPPIPIMHTPPFGTNLVVVVSSSW